MTGNASVSADTGPIHEMDPGDGDMSTTTFPRAVAGESGTPTW